MIADTDSFTTDTHSTITDTHCHLIDEHFAADTEEVIERAVKAGVTRMVMACCDCAEYAMTRELCGRHEQVLLPTLGIHPENMADDIDSQLDEMERLLRRDHASLTAVGEIGLDLYWDKSRLDDQKKVLARQMLLALEYDLPVLLHLREAMTEFIDLLHNIYNEANRQGKRIRGILHCYSGTIEQAEEAMTMGDFWLGIGGTVTYKKSDRIEIVKHFGLNHIVLETDAPYLAPVPHRGKRNEPAYTACVAHFIAEALGTTEEEVAQMTTANAKKLFNFQ